MITTSLDFLGIHKLLSNLVKFVKSSAPSVSENESQSYISLDKGVFVSKNGSQSHIQHATLVTELTSVMGWDLNWRIQVKKLLV